MKTDEEIQHCLSQLERANDRLALIEGGVRYTRGVFGQPTTDVTQKAKEQDELNVRYWKKRLEILGHPALP